MLRHTSDLAVASDDHN
uniref:Uncharacterized protein n=1 Tax=Arundo donax TaxID=35708 RepID=A0A0A9HA12_ARUDO